MGTCNRAWLSISQRRSLEKLLRTLPLDRLLRSPVYFCYHRSSNPSTKQLKLSSNECKLYQGSSMQVESSPATRSRSLLTFKLFSKLSDLTTTELGDKGLVVRKDYNGPVTCFSKAPALSRATVLLFSCSSSVLLFCVKNVEYHGTFLLKWKKGNSALITCEVKYFKKYFLFYFWWLWLMQLQWSTLIFWDVFSF